MKPVWGLDGVVLPLVQAICQMPRPFANAKAMAFEHKGEIVGGLVFNNWEPEHGTIEVTVAATNPRWMTREILSEAARYAFEKCKCHALVARTTEKNPSARMWRSLGADETSIPHLLGYGKPQVVFVLTERQWKKSKFRRQ